VKYWNITLETNKEGSSDRAVYKLFFALSSIIN